MSQKLLLAKYPDPTTTFLVHPVSSLSVVPITPITLNLPTARNQSKAHRTHPEVVKFPKITFHGSQRTHIVGNPLFSALPALTPPSPQTPMKLQSSTIRISSLPNRTSLSLSPPPERRLSISRERVTSPRAAYPLLLGAPGTRA